MINLPGPFIIVDPNSDNAVTVTDEGSGIYSLDVNVKSGEIETPGINPAGATIVYDKYTENQTIANGSWTTVYNLSSSGKLYYTILVFDTSNIDIRVTIDGTIIMNDFNLNELGTDYRLEADNTAPMLPPWIYTWDTNRAVALQFGQLGSKFDSSLKIEARAYLNNKELTRGLVVRSTV